MSRNICLVCGYDKLDNEPYDKDDNPSFEVCSCCGFEFGFNEKQEIKEYRENWINSGLKWFIPSKRMANWNFEKQLNNLKDL